MAPQNHFSNGIEAFNHFNGSARTLKSDSHTNLFLEQIAARGAIANSHNKTIGLDGQTLNLSDVVSVARYGSATTIETQAYQKMIASREALDTRLANGEIIYGVNTGFGGSADVRTKQTQQLQRVLIRELHYGLLPKVETSTTRSDAIDRGDCFDLSIENPAEWNRIPLTWTRAAILIRINSLIKGGSGVRPVVIERLQDLLKHNIIPIIPLRGSISASGDLSPLSYIGGAILGKRTIRIFSKTEQNLTADRAFADAGLQPVCFQAKEGLAVVNGTAVSCATAALALFDSHGIAVLSQVLTAMSVEALTGTVQSFDPFFAETRPHSGQVHADAPHSRKLLTGGQIESAQNIRDFLRSSKLTKVNDGAENSLRQDRYSIRTASQWVGPILEDFVLADQQIRVECNSVTDNPLISPEGDFLHGGNFQAKAVTSAMEKVRQGLQGLGRMLYTQCTELINPATNRGLPPNLVAEDPSLSYIFKGADLNAAALLSELGFLANPVNHVQSAEMGNQSLNSLALISARYTHTAVDVLSQLIASHLLSLCQALDLRALHWKFLESYRLDFTHFIQGRLMKRRGDAIISTDDLEEKAWQRLLKAFDETVSRDAQDRFTIIAKAVREAVIDNASSLELQALLVDANDMVVTLAESLRQSWCAFRDAYLSTESLGDASSFLSLAGQRMYNFVRKDLHVPMLHSKKLETPKPKLLENEDSSEAPTVGYYKEIIYRAVRDGRMAKVVAEIIHEARLAHRLAE